MSQVTLYGEQRPQVKRIRGLIRSLIAGPRFAATRNDHPRSIALAPQAIEAAPAIQPGSLPVWLKDHAVRGIGLGAKIKDGVTLERPALRVYVEAKRPLEDIAAPVPKNVGALETDVIEIGRLQPQPVHRRVRPIQPGCSLGHVKATGGTLGCIVRKRGGGPERFILSNAHVLASNGKAAIGDEIVQPAIADGGVAGQDRIATLGAFVPFNYATDGFPNVVDAALAEIARPPIAYRLAFLGGNSNPSRLSNSVRVGMKVQKTGRSTGHSWGRIIDTDFQAIVPYPDPDDPAKTRNVLFRDQVLCTRFTDPGDSGALVLSSSGRVVGLHFAGSPDVSVFNRISRVFEALDVELETSDG